MPASTPPASTPRRARWRKALVALEVVAATCLFAEIGLRLTDLGDPSLYTFDDQRGYALRPGASGWWHQEGGAAIQINSAGMRDVEHTPAKPPHTLRIAVVGDSFPEALQLPLADSFEEVVGRTLATCPRLQGQPVEVLNFGVSGYGTAQELQTLRTHVWQYDPDLVLLAVTTGNDIIDNSRALTQDPNRPFFVYQDGALVLDDSFRSSEYYRSRTSGPAAWYYGVLYQSRLLQALTGLKARWDASRQAAGATDAPTGKPPTDGTAAALYRTPTDPRWQVAWQVTEGLLTLMRDEVAAHHAGFLVVTLANGVQVLPDPSTGRAFLQRVGGSDLFYPDQRIAAFGQQQGFAVQVLAPPMADYATQHNLYLHGYDTAHLGQGHWNASGHRVAGELIAARLCAGTELTAP